LILLVLKRRLVNVKISRDFAILGKVMGNGGRSLVVLSYAAD
jgi:hypothetical protein